jgi:hypothetical protein
MKWIREIIGNIKEFNKYDKADKKQNDLILYVWDFEILDFLNKDIMRVHLGYSIELQALGDPTAVDRI